MDDVENKCLKFLNEQLKNELDNIKETYVSTNEAAPRINDDTVPKVRKKYTE